MIFKIDYEKDVNKLVIWNLSEHTYFLSISISDIDSKHNIYNYDTAITSLGGNWVMPIPIDALKHYNRSGFFRGYEICIYLQDRITLLETHEIWYDKDAPIKARNIFPANPWNSTWINYTELFVENFYNQNDMNISGICLDIGANDGLYTEYLLSCGASRVYSMECDPRSVKFLNKRFNHDDRVVVVDKGLWNECLTDVKLAYKEITSTTSSFKDQAQHYQEGKYFYVDTWDFSMLKRKMNIDRINFVKIDIEGAEYEVFESMSDEDIKSIDSFLVEIHWNENGKIYQITDRLKKLGFQIKLRRHTEDNNLVEDEHEWKNYYLCTFYANKLV